MYKKAPADSHNSAIFGGEQNHSQCLPSPTGCQDNVCDQHMVTHRRRHFYQNSIRRMIRVAQDKDDGHKQELEQIYGEVQGFLSQVGTLQQSLEGLAEARVQDNVSNSVTQSPNS